MISNQMINTVVKKIPAERYIPTLYSSASELKTLAENPESIYDINFRNTPLGQIENYKDILDENGRLLPGKAPMLSAYKIESLMDQSDDKIEALYKTNNYYELETPELTKATIKLNYTDKYIYNVTIQGMGTVLQASTASDAVFNDNELFYKDSLIFNEPIKPQEILEAFKDVNSEVLSNLPSQFKLTQASSFIEKTKKLYWFTPDSFDTIVVAETKDSIYFTDISNSDLYKFSKFKVAQIETLNSSDINFKNTLRINNQLGFMRKIER